MLKSSMVVPPEVLLFLGIALVIFGPLCFHVNNKIIYTDDNFHNIASSDP